MSTLRVPGVDVENAKTQSSESPTWYRREQSRPEVPDLLFDRESSYTSEKQGFLAESISAYLTLRVHVLIQYVPWPYSIPYMDTLGAKVYSTWAHGPLR